MKSSVREGFVHEGRKDADGLMWIEEFRLKGMSEVGGGRWDDIVEERII